MKKKWFLPLIFFTLVASANAQFRKIPAEVTDAFKTKYATASSVSWKDKWSAFQAEFKVGEKEMKSIFSNKGEWRKTEIKHNYVHLPLEVKDGFKKSKYAEMNVLDIIQIEEKDKQTQFHVTVKKTDFGKKHLVFSKTGQLLSDNGLL
jgi:hypothetical protein